MTHDEFLVWMEEEVRERRMSQQQFDDLLQQKSIFDAKRTTIEAQHAGMVVGFVDGAMQIGGTVHEVFDRAESRAPGRMVYFESVGFDIA